MPGAVGDVLCVPGAGMHELPRVEGRMEQTAAHTESPEKGLGIVSPLDLAWEGSENSSPRGLGSVFL